MFEYRSRLLRFVPVARHDVRAGNHHLADFTSGQLRAVGVLNADAAAHNGSTAASRQRVIHQVFLVAKQRHQGRCFRGPVNFNELGGRKCAAAAADNFRSNRRAAVDKRLKTADIARVRVLLFGNGRQHRGHAKGNVDAVFFDQV